MKGRGGCFTLPQFMILLVSHGGDLQGDAVGRRLDASGTAYQRLNPARFATSAFYSINPCSDRFAAGDVFSSFTGETGRSADSSQPWTAIYWRRPAPVEDRLSVVFPAAHEVSKAEAYHAFRLAMESLPARMFPLGHPVAMERASNKLLQLKLAKKMGFHVPDTLVGNDPEALSDFLARHKNVVVKPAHAHCCYGTKDRSKVDQILWCHGVDPEKLRARLRPGQRTQLMLQERIVKKEDWRITVLPHITVCCRIDTVSLPADQPDWRKSPRKFAHSLFEPPGDFEHQLRTYLSGLDLKAGYFDFAVGVDGTPWFLEVNTNAEWFWIEELTGFPISEEVARCLRGEV